MRIIVSLSLTLPTFTINAGFNSGPGSSIFVFSGRQTVDAGDSPTKSSFIGSAREFTYLHCGDFRACPAHILHPAIRGQRLDIVYLDTTYLNPKVSEIPHSFGYTDVLRTTILSIVLFPASNTHY